MGVWEVVEKLNAFIDKCDPNMQVSDNSFVPDFPGPS